jgi:hypothetical protein
MRHIYVRSCAIVSVSCGAGCVYIHHMRVYTATVANMARAMVRVRGVCIYTICQRWCIHLLCTLANMARASASNNHHIRKTNSLFLLLCLLLCLLLT